MRGWVFLSMFFILIIIILNFILLYFYTGSTYTKIFRQTLKRNGDDFGYFKLVKQIKDSF